MKIKIAELDETISNLRAAISSLEERIAKEESDKLVRLFAAILRVDIPSDFFLLPDDIDSHDLTTRKLLLVMEKNRKPEVQLSRCKLLFQLSLREFGKRNQLLRER